MGSPNNTLKTHGTSKFTRLVPGIFPKVLVQGRRHAAISVLAHSVHPPQCSMHVLCSRARRTDARVVGAELLGQRVTDRWDRLVVHVVPDERERQRDKEVKRGQRGKERTKRQKERTKRHRSGKKAAWGEGGQERARSRARDEKEEGDRETTHTNKETEDHRSPKYKALISPPPKKKQATSEYWQASGGGH